MEINDLLMLLGGLALFLYGMQMMSLGLEVVTTLILLPVGSLLPKLSAKILGDKDIETMSVNNNSNKMYVKE